MVNATNDNGKWFKFKLKYLPLWLPLDTSRDIIHHEISAVKIISDININAYYKETGN